MRAARLFPAALLAFSTLPAPAGTIGGIQSTPVSFAASPDAMATGGDGNVWIVDRTRNIVGRLAPDGTLATYPVPTADGNLWYVSAHSAVVTPATPMGFGRLRYDGTFLPELPLPAGVVPGRGAPGANGAIWFTDTSNNQIGSIATDGTVSAYEFATPGKGNVGG